MERTKNDVWVGLFVLLGAAAILFLALQSANLLSLSFQQTYHVAAKFDNIGGLKPKAAVKSVVFGVAVTFIAVLEGFEAQPTPEGVSRATTRTVVVSSLSVLGLDFVLTTLMFSI